MKNLSLKLRLMLLFLVTAAGVWIASGVLVWFESKEQIDEFFDTYQLILARQLSAADWDGIKPSTQTDVNQIIKNLEDDGEEDDEALGLAVFDASGKMIFNDNENGKHFHFYPASGFTEQALGKKQKPWRIVWVKSVNGDYFIAVGQEIEYRNDIALEMIEEALIPWGYGLAAMLLIFIALLAKEFGPLKSLAANIAARQPDDLSPIDNQNIPQEVLPLIGSFNNLLAKLENMLKRERSFIADSAHELRSPLTALKVQLDVVEIAGDDENTRNNALKNLREGIERASRLVEQLLALSKLNAQQITNDNETLDWQNIINHSVNEQKTEAESKNITITTKCTKEPFITTGQPFLWNLLFRNLLDNAIKYSGKGAEIKITLTAEKLEITNSKVSLAPEHVKRLGERFFRPAGQNVKGSGLGLSIVERIAVLHGCKVSFSLEDNVFRVVIRP